jgi:carboxyl-terminal processing protease
MTRSSRRPSFIVLLLSLLLAVAGLTSAPPAPADAAEASIIFAALQVLVDRHIERPDALKLLAAGLGGLRQALGKAGLAERLDDLTATAVSAARREFQTRFDRAAYAAHGRLTGTDLQYTAVRAMAASIGTSHTAFRDPSQWDERQRLRRNEPSYSGVGTRSIVRDGRFYFLEVYTDGPAARAGVEAFDRVVAVDGLNTGGMSLTEFSARLRGADGAPVALTLQRPGQAELITVTVSRAPVIRPMVEHALLDGATGYIRFAQFNYGGTALVRQAIEALHRQGMRGLLLDLRANSGGLVTELRQVAGLLLRPGLTIAVREDRQGDRAVDVTAGTPAIRADTPLAVLIDDATASAAELLAAAVQEYGRGAVLGTRSAGAVLNSTDFPLPGGTAIQVPIRRVATGRGVVLEGSGVRPETVVVLTAEDLDRGIDAQVRHAAQHLALRAVSPKPSGLIARFTESPAFSAPVVAPAGP